MKTAVQLFAAVLVAVLPLMTSPTALTVVEWVNVGIVATAAAGVWLARNTSESETWAVHARMILSAVSAGAVLALSLLSDGAVTGAEWTQIIVAALATLAVHQVSDQRPTLRRGRHAAPDLAALDDEDTVTS